MTDATTAGSRPLAMHERLDEQAARLVAEMAERPVLPYPRVTAEEVRAHYRALSRWAAPPVAVDEVVDRRAADVPVRIYRTRDHGWGGGRPLLVFLHSGGWVVGGLVASDERCRRLAATTGCVVASVDYRLAPEHSYPVPLDDCWSAVCALAADATALGADAQRLVLVGDSAGGNLAAAVALRARDRGTVAVALQVLLYPVTASDRTGFASAGAYTAGLPLTPAELDWFTASYLGGGVHNAETAPLSAPDLCGLPPALVITAECDVLRDEGEAYAARLRAVGVPTELHRFTGTVHGFFACSGALDAARDATRLITASLGTHFPIESASGGTTP